MPRFDRHLNEPAIFLQSFELSKIIFHSTSQLPKPNRYVLGNKLERTSLEFVLMVNNLVGPSGIRFSKGERRQEILSKLSFLLDEFRILLRMARETGAYSAGQYQDLSDRTQAIGRQIGGMMRLEKRDLK